MSDIQRYGISNCGDVNCDPLVIDDDGPYVEYNDVKSIIAERDQLKAENAALRQSLTDVRDSVEREYWGEYAGLDETREILDKALGKQAVQ